MAGTTPEELRAVLKRLTDQARKDGLWLYTDYQGLWFSPDQLDAANDEGRFLWGPVNWELRDPAEKLAALDRAVTAAEKERDNFKGLLARR